MSPKAKVLCCTAVWAATASSQIHIVSSDFRTTYIIRILEFLCFLLRTDPSFSPFSISRAEFVQVTTMETFLAFQRGPARALGAPIMATVQFRRLGKPLNRVLRERGHFKKRQWIDFKKAIEVRKCRVCLASSARYFRFLQILCFPFLPLEVSSIPLRHFAGYGQYWWYKEQAKAAENSGSL